MARGVCLRVLPVVQLTTSTAGPKLKTLPPVGSDVIQEYVWG